MMLARSRADASCLIEAVDSLAMSQGTPGRLDCLVEAADSLAMSQGSPGYE